MQSSAGSGTNEIRIDVAAGKLQFVEIPDNTILYFDFDPQAMTLVMVGDDLVVSSADGGQTVLKGYASVAGGEFAPEIHLMGGQVLSGSMLLTVLEGEDFSLNTMADNGGFWGSGLSDLLTDTGQFIEGVEPSGRSLGAPSQPTPGNMGADDLFVRPDTDEPLPLEASGPSSEYDFSGYRNSAGVIEDAGIVFGTDGNDTIVGDGILVDFAGDDLVIGKDMDNLITNGPGADTLFGGGGNDWIVDFGDDGNDVVYASTGHDTITLGQGEDVVIVHENALGSGRFMEITDYQYEGLADTVDLRGDLAVVDFGDNASGNLEFLIEGGSGETTSIELAGVTRTEVYDHIHTNDVESSADDLIQYMIDHSRVLG